MNSEEKPTPPPSPRVKYRTISDDIKSLELETKKPAIKNPDQNVFAVPLKPVAKKTQTKQ